LNTNCSQLTGFTISGLCNALTDLVNAFPCRGHLDHVARRMWAIFRQECVELDPATGSLRLTGLVGADKINPGNYRANEYAILPILAYVAGEYGGQVVQRFALDLLEKGFGEHTTSTGATALNRDKASGTMNGCMVRASLLRREDWKNLISKVRSPSPVYVVRRASTSNMSIEYDYTNRPFYRAPPLITLTGAL
jgi:Linalool dehydratase/isomerase